MALFECANSLVNEDMEMQTNKESPKSPHDSAAAHVNTHTHTPHLALLSEDIRGDPHLLQVSATEPHLLHGFCSHEQQLLCLHGWAPL